MSGKAEERIYDVRVLERNIRKGLLTRKDLEKHLKSLPDRETNADYVRVGPAQDDDEPVGANGHAGG
jgi:hypothetical protein